MGELNKRHVAGTAALTITNDGSILNGVAVPNSITITRDWQNIDGADRKGNMESRYPFDDKIKVDLQLALRHATAQTLADALPLLGPTAKVTIATTDDPDLPGDYMVEPGTSKAYTNTGEMVYNLSLVRSKVNTTITVLA